MFIRVYVVTSSIQSNRVLLMSNQHICHHAIYRRAYRAAWGPMGGEEGFPGDMSPFRAPGGGESRCSRASQGAWVPPEMEGNPGAWGPPRGHESLQGPGWRGISVESVLVGELLVQSMFQNRFLDNTSWWRIFADTYCWSMRKIYNKCDLPRRYPHETCISKKKTVPNETHLIPMSVYLAHRS